MRETLVNLKRAVKGEVVMTPELDAVGSAMAANKVPALWMKVSFASLKPLGSYMVDLQKRLAMFNDWVANGPPNLFWISGIFFTQAFFTGLLQNYARITQFPIDKCIWNFYLQKESFELQGKCKQGCYFYGLYMEGARWDDNTMAVGESLPKVLFAKMPTFYLDPVLNTEDKTPEHIYNSPCYKTSARRGVLSTTGHSTNFIMMMALPIEPTTTAEYWNKRGVALLSQLDD
jgi:dynein heavy chain